MHLLWTWGGEFFGYREGDNLWTHNGQHVGRFYGDEVYSNNGFYLGELRQENRLITQISKMNQRRGSSAPYASRVGIVAHVNYVGYVMLAGYEDFPNPDSF